MDLFSQSISKPQGAKRSAGGDKPFFQPKLTVNQPNDAYEQEADKMADAVAQTADPAVQQDTFFSPAAGGLQRKCQTCEEEDKFVHRKGSDGNGIKGSEELDSYVSNLGSSGEAMPEAGRQFFEPKFGHDFSGVRLHTDSAAATSAASINALAYTSGNNIVFNSGQYSPETTSGKRLIAHELTHVVQQNGARSNISKSTGNMVQRAGWSDAKKMNKSAQNIDKDGNVSTTTASTILRIPIDGLKAGNQDNSMTKQVTKTDKDDPKKQTVETVAVSTAEKAAGKAIALVPDSLDPTKPVEILLHLHGFNEGYRQVGNSVRDIGLDKIEQQMLSSGHTQMIAILPQESTKSGLGTGGFNSDAYITEVLGKVQTEKQWAQAPGIGRVILSAHSGGGGRVEELLGGAGGNQLPGKMQELTLFEAINGPNELAAVKKFVSDQIQKDVTSLKTGDAAAHADYLAKSMRFRGYYTPQGQYVKRYQELDQHLQSEFKKLVDPAGLDPGDAAQIKANYQVFKTGETGADHDGIMGNGNKLEDSLKALPAMPQPAVKSAPPTTTPAVQPGAGAASGTVTGAFNTPDSKSIGSGGSTITVAVHIDFLPDHTHLHIFTATERGGDYVTGAPLQVIGEPGKGGDYKVVLSPAAAGAFIRFEARSDTTNINLPNVVGTFSTTPG